MWLLWPTHYIKMYVSKYRKYQVTSLVQSDHKELSYMKAKQFNEFCT